MDRFAWCDGALAPDELTVLEQGGVRVYDGDDKVRIVEELIYDCSPLPPVYGLLYAYGLRFSTPACASPVCHVTLTLLISCDSDRHWT